MYEAGDLISSISKKFKVCESVIKRIERQYIEHGIKSFKAKGKKYEIFARIEMEIVNRILKCIVNFDD